jgi:hypothetical protein
MLDPKSLDAFKQAEQLRIDIYNDYQTILGLIEIYTLAIRSDIAVAQNPMIGVVDCKDNIEELCSMLTDELQQNNKPTELISRIYTLQLAMQAKKQSYVKFCHDYMPIICDNHEQLTSLIQFTNNSVNIDDEEFDLPF